MPKDKSSQGIVLDEKAQEQPKDRERAQSAVMTEGMLEPPGKLDELLKQIDDEEMNFHLASTAEMKATHRQRADDLRAGLKELRAGLKKRNEPRNDRRS